MEKLLAEALKLNVNERIQLVQDIWDSIAAQPEAILLTDADKAEIDRRLEDCRQNPDDYITWEELQQKFERRAALSSSKK
jgi:putative addiction module component (TIGR02574 family)